MCNDKHYLNSVLFSVTSCTWIYVSRESHFHWKWVELFKQLDIWWEGTETKDSVKETFNTRPSILSIDNMRIFSHHHHHYTLQKEERGWGCRQMDSLVYKNVLFMKSDIQIDLKTKYGKWFYLHLKFCNYPKRVIWISIFILVVFITTFKTFFIYFCDV